MMITPQPGDRIRLAFYEGVDLTHAEGLVLAFDDGLLTVDLAVSPADRPPRAPQDRTFNVRSAGFLWYEDADAQDPPPGPRVTPRSIAGGAAR